MTRAWLSGALALVVSSACGNKPPPSADAGPKAECTKRDDCSGGKVSTLIGLPVVSTTRKNDW